MGRGITKAIQKIKYLTADEIILIHDTVLNRFGGGEEGIFFNGKEKLESIITRMREGYFDHQPFDTLIKKTAFMFQSILIYHPFVDGMKRTGIYSSLAFLMRNQYLLIKKDIEKEIEFASSVADSSIEKDPEKSLEKICDWFRNRMISFDDNKGLGEHFANSEATFKCPRCGNTSITFKNPSCIDCNSQFYHATIDIDGIVESGMVNLYRAGFENAKPLPIYKPSPHGLYI